METTAATCHDSKPLPPLLDKTEIESGTRIHADKAYCSQKHRDALKSRGIKNGIQDRAMKNKPLTLRQLQRNHLITKVRYVVERTFGSQVRWLAVNSALLWSSQSACLSYLTSLAYSLKRLPKLYTDSLLPTLS